MTSAPIPTPTGGAEFLERRKHLRLVTRDGTLTIDGVPVGPIFGGTMPTGDVLTFDALLDLLGYSDDEFVSICHKIGDGGPFTSAVCSPTNAPAKVAKLPNGANIWFGVNPTSGPARSRRGRGKDEDVTRLSALPADLDVKPGGCADLETAFKIIDDLSEILGTRPSAVTHSGGGLHPYWVVSDGNRNGDGNGHLRALLKRWGRLVQAIAEQHGAKADSVFDLTRILRVPGTFNHKNGSPVPVECHRGVGSALTPAEIDTALNVNGIKQIDDYPDEEAKPKSNPDTWTFANETCEYIQAMVRGWADPNTVEKGVGRHQWLLAQATWLNLAKMLGCISSNDYKHAKDVLEQTVTHLCATRNPKRGVPPGELADAFKYGIAKAATKTKKEARKELGDHTHDKPAQRSQASRLVDIALDSYRLGISNVGRPFAYHPDVRHVAMDLRGSKLGLRQALARDYFKKFDAAPTQASIGAAMGVLEGMSREQVPVELNLRVAGDAEAVHIDMADTGNRVIEISGGTWRIIDSSPHMFRRTELTAPMPQPVCSGELEGLWSYLNIAAEDRALVLAVVVDALINPGTAKPITGFTGEHGRAKTASSTRFAQLIDPSTVDLQNPPKDLEHWLSTAAGSWVVGLDNLSSLPDWLSDAFCRAATGSGNVKRTLYTDDNLSVYRFRRCVVFNGIDLGGLRGDLADRLISFDLQQISRYDSEAELKDAWRRDWPVVFGGLLNLAARIHKMLPAMADQPDLPRMADFARVLTCVDEIEGTEGMGHYRDRLRRGLAQSATGDSFLRCLVDARYDTSDAGKSAAEILVDMNRLWASSAISLSMPRDWPCSARGVTSLLRRNAPVCGRWAGASATTGGTTTTTRSGGRFARPTMARPT